MDPALGTWCRYRETLQGSWLWPTTARFPIECPLRAGFSSFSPPALQASVVSAGVELLLFWVEFQPRKTLEGFPFHPPPRLPGIGRKLTPPSSDSTLFERCEPFASFLPARASPFDRHSESPTSRFQHNRPSSKHRFGVLSSRG